MTEKRMCSCGRMACDAGLDLCRACEEDYYAQQVAGAQGDAEREAMEREAWERDQEEPF